MAAALCLLAFVITFFAARRSLALGLIAAVGIGYFYGILRANVPNPASHFIFDAGLIGFYFQQRWTTPAGGSGRDRILGIWTVILVGWPVLVALLPFQNLMVTLVGLRGNTFFVPMLLVGSWLRHRDLLVFSYGIACLNLIALGFAGAEYFLGVPRFFPVSEVTSIIHASTDAGGGFNRIPATFSNAHSYAGTMVASMPLLFGAWAQANQSSHRRLLVVLGFAAAMLGVLMASTRTHFLIGGTIAFVGIFTSRFNARQRAVSMVLIVLASMIALTNERFQRFKSLGDTDAVMERVAGSVNRTFWEILAEYPLGNGLGGGGTSLPYFLQAQVRIPVAMENEYARILLEQGVIGFTIWVGFLGWFVMRRSTAFARSAWVSGRRLAWIYSAIMFCTAFMGLGLLASVPQTVLMLLNMGWAGTQPAAEPQSVHKGSIRRAAYSWGSRPEYAR